LTSLMTKGYLDPSLFNTQSNELQKETAMLKEKQKTLSRSVNGGMVILSEVEQLLKWAAKADAVDCFEGTLFERIVENIIVYSQEEVGSN